MFFSIIGFLITFAGCSLIINLDFANVSDNFGYFLALALGSGIKSFLCWLLGLVGAYAGYQIKKCLQRKSNESSTKTADLMTDTNKSFSNNNLSDSVEIGLSEKLKNSYISSWRKAFVFKGKANRFEFWTFILINHILSFAIGYVLGYALLDTGVQIANLISLIYFIIANAITARRLHDTGRSAKVLWSFPIITILLFAYIMQDVNVQIIALFGLLYVVFGLYILICALLPTNKTSKY